MVSIGITMSKMGETIDEILTRGEKALYAAKQNGRNHVEAV